MPKKATIIMIFLLTCLLLAACSKPPASHQTINIVFRYDDYSAISNTAFSSQLVDLFRSYNAPITFAVIPMTESGNPLHLPEIRSNEVLPLTAENAALLQAGINDGVLEIAMHGFSHQNNNGARSSEFTNVALEKQLADLTRGKAHLESTISAQVKIFVPPWNTYDLTTLQVLDQLGFTIVSANRGGVKSDQTDIAYIPYTCTITNVKEGVEAARKAGHKESLLVVLLHEYDFKDVIGRDGIITLKNFSKTIKWLDNQPDIRIITLEEAAAGQFELLDCPKSH